MCRLHPARVALLLLSLVSLATAQVPSVVAGRTADEWRADLRHPQPLVRQAAIEALLRFDALDAASVSELTSLGRDPDQAVRRTAIRGLASAGTRARAALSMLDRAWRTDDALVSADAAAALLLIEPRTVARFAEALHAPDPALRARAALALASAPPRTRVAIHALRDALSDAELPVRERALRALEALDPAPGRTTVLRVRDLLDRELADDPALTSASAIDRVESAVRLLVRAGSQAGHARTVLRTLLFDGPVPVRTSAASCLLRASDGVRVLDRALVDGDEHTRRAAITALRARGDRRVSLRATVDSLRNPGFAHRDPARARELLAVIGATGQPTRAVRRVFAELARDTSLAPAVDAARRRIARDRE